MLVLGGPFCRTPQVEGLFRVTQQAMNVPAGSVWGVPERLATGEQPPFSLSLS